MALSAVILGSVVAIAGALTLMSVFAVGPLAALGFALLAGQATTVLFIAKALCCQSLRQARAER